MTAPLLLPVLLPLLLLLLPFAPAPLLDDVPLLPLSAATVKPAGNGGLIEAICCWA